MAQLQNVFIDNNLKVNEKLISKEIYCNLSGTAQSTNSLVTGYGDVNTPVFINYQGVPQTCSVINNLPNYIENPLPNANNISLAMQSNAIVLYVNAIITSAGGIIIDSYRCYGEVNETYYDYSDAKTYTISDVIALNELLAVTQGNILHYYHRQASDVIINIMETEIENPAIAFYSFDSSRIVGTKKHLIINNCTSTNVTISCFNEQGTVNYLLVNGSKETLYKSTIKKDIIIKNNRSYNCTVFLPNDNTTCFIIDY